MGKLGSLTGGRLRAYPLLGAKVCVWSVDLQEAEPRRMRVWLEGQVGVRGILTSQGRAKVLGRGVLGGPPPSILPLPCACDCLRRH